MTDRPEEVDVLERIEELTHVPFGMDEIAALVAIRKLALTGARSEPRADTTAQNVTDCPEQPESLVNPKVEGVGDTEPSTERVEGDIKKIIDALAENVTESSHIEPEQACPPTKVCVKWGCEKVELVKDGKYHVCPTCRDSYGECPHPDFAEHAEKPPHPADWAAYNEWVAERAEQEPDGIGEKVADGIAALSMGGKCYCSMPGFRCTRCKGMDSVAAIVGLPAREWTRDEVTAVCDFLAPTDGEEV